MGRSIETRIAEAASDYKMALANEGFAAENGGADKLRDDLFALVVEWEGETADACGVSRWDAGVGATEYLGCEWTPDTPDACPFCAGSLCNKCGAGGTGFTGHCEHDSLERHEIVARHYPEERGPSDDLRLGCSCGNPDPGHMEPNKPAPREDPQQQ